MKTPLPEGVKVQPTPGPWHVGTGKAARIVYRLDGYAIANAIVHHGTTPEEEMEANARLLASAPELLAACKALVRGGWHDPECAGETGGTCDCGMEARYVAAELAIKKAEGGAP